ncbi:MAG: type II secretion system protein M [Deltaproteobacteria bacterium]|nr:type II secretion system protein M [Deltaproteobacteria bacterium]MBW2416361.1 type II secretion system protein M [Deltaproteobacteria bacterium]
MSAWIARLRELWRARSPRERFVLVIAVCVIALLAIDEAVVTPMQDQVARSVRAIEAADANSLRAAQLAQRIHALRGELDRVEEQIQPGAETNLLALISKLARDAGLADQLEAIKPRQASGSDQYPETRVEVSLKGTTIENTVRLLHAIDQAPLHLIIRSLRIRSQSGLKQLVDVSFYVSSFIRA